MENTELRPLIEENLRLARENNKLLRAMHRSSIYGLIWKIIIWTIILGGPAYVYYAYQPLINSAIQGFTQAKDGFSLSPEKIQALIKQYEATPH